MIKTIGQLATAIVTQEIVVAKTDLSDKWLSAKRAKLDELKAIAAKYPGMVEAAKSGIVSGKHLLQYTEVNGGGIFFVSRDPISFSAHMEDELTQADQEKANKGA